MISFKNPRIRYINLLIVILPIITALIIMLILSYDSILNAFGSSSVTSKDKEYVIESMDYHLRSNATDYQIEIFKELEDAVENNDEIKIVEGVAKNFIADVYTWTNKEDMWDVGGMCYVYSRYRTVTYYELRDTLYQLMAKSKREFDNSQMLEVVGVEVTSCEKSNDLFEIENRKFESYDVACRLNIIGGNIKGCITHNQYLTIIKDTDENGRFEIAVSYGD